MRNLNISEIDSCTKRNPVFCAKLIGNNVIKIQIWFYLTSFRRQKITLWILMHEIMLVLVCKKYNDSNLYPSKLTLCDHIQFHKSMFCR